MKNILIIIDVQNGFIQDDNTAEVVRKLKDLLYLGLFDVVIGTRYINAPNSTFERLFDYTALTTEDEVNIPIELRYSIDWTVDKYTYDCVNSSFIQRLCQLNDGSIPSRVFIAGLDTDCSVLVSASSLFELNIEPIVLADYCYSTGGEEAHEAGLKCLYRLIGRKRVVEKDIKSMMDLRSIIKNLK